MLACCFALASGVFAVAQESTEVLADAGQKALAAGNFGEARSNFERLAKLEPQMAEVHATLGAIYFKQREFDLAVREVRTAMKLKPGLPRLDSLLGLSLSEMDDFKEALPHLEKGFKQTADAEVRRMCGLQLLRAYSGLQRDSDAVETALSLNKLYPEDAEVLYHTGRIYGNFAYVVMMKLHDRAPNSVWMLQAQGEANEAQKDYDSAVIAFNHVLELEPHRPGIHYRLGRIYMARFKSTSDRNDRDAAKREFMAEVEVNAGNGNALYELAQMAADDNNLDEAQRQFEDLVARYPDFEQAIVALGGIYLQKQNGGKAVGPLERATKLNEEDEVAWYRLAQAERAAGNREAAQKALEMFRKLHASSVEARNPHPSDDITHQQLGADVTQ